MIETIEAQTREAAGTRTVMKLRGKGFVPAILYGHGEANVCLAIRQEAVATLIRHGTKLVNLTGAVKDTALLRDVQWDSLGSEIIHLDFARVSQTELVEVTLPVELHGEAPGVAEGGQLRFQTHVLTIRCPAGLIPEHIVVEVSGLHLGQSIHAGEIKLPEGATTVTPASIVVVHVIVPAAVKDDVAAAATAVKAAEPAGKS